MATLYELQQDLAAYKSARDKILNGGQSVRLGDRRIDRGDLQEIERKIQSLESRVAIAQNNGKLGAFRPVFGGSGVS